MRASIASVEALIARENERGVPSSRILMAGFSQGGAIALSAGLRHGEALAGIIALSTYLPLQDAFAAERNPANGHTPMFWGHGTADPIVPLDPRRQFARPAAVAGLSGRAGTPIRWRTRSAAEEVADLRQWMTVRLGV